jgi:hypothetical protein
MYATLDTVSEWAVVYYLTMIVLGALFLLELVTAVLYSAYKEAAESMHAADQRSLEDEREWKRVLAQQNERNEAKSAAERRALATPESPLAQRRQSFQNSHHGGEPPDRDPPDGPAPAASLVVATTESKSSSIHDLIHALPQASSTIDNIYTNSPHDNENKDSYAAPPPNDPHRLARVLRCWHLITIERKKRRRELLRTRKARVARVAFRMWRALAHASHHPNEPLADNNDDMDLEGDDSASDYSGASSPPKLPKRRRSQSAPILSSPQPPTASALSSPETPVTRLAPARLAPNSTGRGSSPPVPEPMITIIASPPSLPSAASALSSPSPSSVSLQPPYIAPSGYLAVPSPISMVGRPLSPLGEGAEEDELPSPQPGARRRPPPLWSPVSPSPSSATFSFVSPMAASAPTPASTNTAPLLPSSATPSSATLPVSGSPVAARSSALSPVSATSPHHLNITINPRGRDFDSDGADDSSKSSPLVTPDPSTAIVTQTPSSPSMGANLTVPVEEFLIRLHTPPSPAHRALPIDSTPAPGGISTMDSPEPIALSPITPLVAAVPVAANSVRNTNDHHRRAQSSPTRVKRLVLKRPGAERDRALRRQELAHRRRDHDRETERAAAAAAHEAEVRRRVEEELRAEQRRNLRAPGDVDRGGERKRSRTQKGSSKGTRDRNRFEDDRTPSTTTGGDTRSEVTSPASSLEKQMSSPQLLNRTTSTHGHGDRKTQVRDNHRDHDDRGDHHRRSTKKNAPSSSSSHLHQPPTRDEKNATSPDVRQSSNSSTRDPHHSERRVHKSSQSISTQPNVSRSSDHGRHRSSPSTVAAATSSSASRHHHTNSNNKPTVMSLANRSADRNKTSSTTIPSRHRAMVDSALPRSHSAGKPLTNTSSTSLVSPEDRRSTTRAILRSTRSAPHPSHQASSSTSSRPLHSSTTTDKPQHRSSSSSTGHHRLRSPLPPPPSPPLAPAPPGTPPSPRSPSSHNDGTTSTPPPYRSSGHVHSSSEPLTPSHHSSPNGFSDSKYSPTNNSGSSSPKHHAHTQSGPPNGERKTWAQQKIEMSKRLAAMNERKRVESVVFEHDWKITISAHDRQPSIGGAASGPSHGRIGSRQIPISRLRGLGESKDSDSDDQEEKARHEAEESGALAIITASTPRGTLGPQGSNMQDLRSTGARAFHHQRKLSQAQQALQSFSQPHDVAQLTPPLLKSSLPTVASSGSLGSTAQLSSSGVSTNSSSELPSHAGWQNSTGYFFFHLAQSKPFRRTILAIIAINTVIMATQFFGQPGYWEDTLRIANYAFTGIFTVEMAINIWGFGPRQYIRDSFNVLDAVVVIANLTEIFVLEVFDTRTVRGLSALRTIRLLRIFKMAKNWKELNRLLKTLLRSLESVANFTVVLFIFVFIYSVIGVQFLAGKMYTEPDEDGLVQVSRSNFDSLLYSIITVFQIIGGENWNAVLYDAVAGAGWWAAAYCVSLLLFGKYVLVKLFLAIMLSNFDLTNEEEEEKARRKREKKRLRREKEKIERLKRAEEKRVREAAAAAAAALIGDDNSGGRLNAFKRRMSKAIRRPSFMGGRTGTTPPTGSTANLQPGLSQASLGIGISTRSLSGLGVSTASLDIPEPMTAPPAIMTPAAPATPVSVRGTNTNLSVPARSTSNGGTSTPPQAVSSGAGLSPIDPNASSRPPGLLVRASSMRGQLSRANSSRRVSIDASIIDSDSDVEDREAATRERRRSSVLGIFNVDAEIKAVDRADDEMQGVGAAVTNSGHLVRLAARGAHRRTASTIGLSGDANAGGFNNPLASLAGVRGPDGQPPTTDALASVSNGPTIATPPIGSLPGSQPGSVASGIGTNDSVVIPGGSATGSGPTDSSSNGSPQWINIDSSGDQSIMAGTSLFCLGEENPFRIGVFRFVSSKIFEWVIFIVICISITLLVLDVFDESVASSASATIYSLSPDPTADTWQVIQFYAAEGTTVVFLIEAILRIIALGFILNQHAYLRTGWNRLDFIVLAASLVVFFIGRDGDQFKFVKSFRVIRALRPLRMIRRLSGMRVVLTAIFRSLTKIVNVMVLNLFFYAIFGIIGIQLFAGLFHQCEDQYNDYYVMDLNSTSCVAQGFEWHNSARTGDFDHMGSALLQLFEISSQEMWPDVMYRGMDCTSVGQSPTRSASAANSLYFIVWLIISNFFLNTLFLGVIVDTFQRMKNQLTGFGFLTPRQKAWLEVKKLFARAKTRVTEFIPPGDANGGCWTQMRRAVFRMVTHQYFELIITGIILLNIIQMCLPYEGQSDAYSDVLLYTNYAFTLIFVIEVVVKFFGLGLQYFCSMWNLFDFAVATLSAWGSMYDILHAGSLGVDAIFRVFRILRIFRILHLKRLRGLRGLVQTLIFSIPAVINISSLMLLLFFVYATMGMALFSGMEYGDQISEQANFDTFPTAMLLLFRCSTGESWNGVMHDIMRRSPPSDLAIALAPPFFVTFIILGSFLMLNLFVAVIMEHFENSGMDAARGTLTMEDLKEFSKAWGHHANKPVWWKFWSDDDKWLPLHKLEAMLWEVKGPLGLADKGLTREDALMYIDSLDIPFYEREKEANDTPTAASAGTTGVQQHQPPTVANLGVSGSILDTGAAYPEADSDMQLYVHYLETMMAVVYRAFKDITADQRRKDLAKRDVAVPGPGAAGYGNDPLASLPPSRPPTPPPPTAHHSMAPPPPSSPPQGRGSPHQNHQDGTPPPPPFGGVISGTTSPPSVGRSMSPPLPPPPPLSRASTWANLQAARGGDGSVTPPPQLLRTSSPPMLTSTPNPSAIPVIARHGAASGHRRNSLHGSTGSGHGSGAGASLLPTSPPLSTGGATRAHHSRHHGSQVSGSGSGSGHHRSQSPPGGATTGTSEGANSSEDEIDAIGDHLAVHKSITDNIRRRHSELLAANASPDDGKDKRRKSLKLALGKRFGRNKKRMSRVNPQLAGLAFQRLVHGMGSSSPGNTSPPLGTTTISPGHLPPVPGLSSPSHPVPIAAGRRPAHQAGHHGPLAAHGTGLSISIPHRDDTSSTAQQQQPMSGLLSPPSTGLPPMTPFTASSTAHEVATPMTAGAVLAGGIAGRRHSHHLSRSLTDPEGLSLAIHGHAHGHGTTPNVSGLPPPRPQLGRRRSGFQTQLLV